ncbi:hypothetical protein CspHIS471_0702850 [Cutaneotrichosporon sp. HIS471]|nr:hypothetical protein CspHIS471_0702850 [Cutaneotrichosporon sp. HIS471]
MEPLQFYTVNAFANSPHSGSQAAVVLFPANDPRWNDETYLQAVAGDFAWPATVYLSPLGDAYAIRWFTKAGELPLCGHGTCAAAAVVFALQGGDKVNFEHPNKGPLSASLEGEVEGGLRIGISLPITPTTVSPDERQDLRKDLSSTTGLEASDVIRVARYDWGGKSAVVQLDPETELAGLHVDPKALGAHYTVTILTQAIGVKDGMVQIRSRVFIPSIGLDEDTVTGSAHSVLTGYYLSTEGGGRNAIEALMRDPNEDGDVDCSKPSTVILDGKQLSPRGGSIRCSLVNGRAWLVGKAYVMGSGTLTVF